MTSTLSMQSLSQYLTDQYALEPGQAERIVDEVASYFDLSVEDFVRARHQQLQREGLSNTVAFERLQIEISDRRFPAPTLSERQIRRIVYG